MTDTITLIVNNDLLCTIANDTIIDYPLDKKLLVILIY